MSKKLYRIASASSLKNAVEITAKGAEGAK